MGDALNFIPTNKFTLQSDKWQNIWVMGDANNIPASKAGAVIHFQNETVVENILAHMDGKEMPSKFDGHSTCYIETGFNKATLIDFSYEQEPLPGKYPFPVIGPFLPAKRIPHKPYRQAGFPLFVLGSDDAGYRSATTQRVQYGW